MFSVAAGAVLALAFASAAFAQYPSQLEINPRTYPLGEGINLPELPRIFQNLEGLGQKAMNFFGVEAFTREIQDIDFYGLFAKGRQLAVERIPWYQAELRRFCPSGCNLPEIIRSVWGKIRGLW